jgi:hypothetical protein
MMTPYEKLKSLAGTGRYLKLVITFEILDELAMRISDNESVIQLRTERNKLFNLIFELIFEQDRHSLKTPNLKLEKPFGFRNRITISV